MIKNIVTGRDLLTAKSLATQFTDLHHFRLAGMGEILLMCGTSTSGKSVITEKFLKIAPRTIEWNLDLLYDPSDIRTEEMIQKFAKDAINMSIKGYSLLMHSDNPDILSSMMQVFNIRVPVKTILIFCPLNDLSERVEIRNQNAQEYAMCEEFRDALIPIHQYSILYGATNSHEYLEILDKKEVCSIYKDQFNKMIKSLQSCYLTKDSASIIEAKKDEYCKDFLYKLGFNNKSTIKIGPKEEYDLIIRNLTMPLELLKDGEYEDDQHIISSISITLAGELANYLGYSDKYIESIFNMEH
jgi:hypothetical protein